MNNEKKERYFDYAASSIVSKKVISQLSREAINLYGNPSSSHKKGYEVKKRIEETREYLASIIYCNKDDIFFTSGGTESNNLLIDSLCKKYKGIKNHIITTKIEHKSILFPLKEKEKEGFRISYLDVDSSGKISTKQLMESISPDTFLITIGYVNNEIGSIQDIREIGEIARANKIFFHTDAVQALGLYEINVNEMKIDSLSCSGHKFGGLKGTGFLYCKKEFLSPIIFGGGQEKQVRSGTENTFGIFSMKYALEEICIKPDNIQKIHEFLRKNLEQIGGKINICQQSKCHIINVYFEGISNEGLINYLDLHNIFISAGSACIGNATELSHVLEALGYSKDRIKQSIRISFSHNTKIKDCKIIIDEIRNYININKGIKK